MPAHLIITLLGTGLLNLPFGYWRAGVPKYTWAWFAAIHLPVLFAAGLRLALDIPWQPVLVPLWAAALFCGQFTGGLLRRHLQLMCKLRPPRS